MPAPFTVFWLNMQEELPRHLCLFRDHLDLYSGNLGQIILLSEYSFGQRYFQTLCIPTVLVHEVGL